MLSREIGETMVERRSGKIIFTDSLLPAQGTAGPPMWHPMERSGGSPRPLRTSGGVQCAGECHAAGHIATDHTATLRRTRFTIPRSGHKFQLAAGVRRKTQGVAVFLASRASDYLSGSVIVVTEAGRDARIFQTTLRWAPAQCLVPGSECIGLVPQVRGLTHDRVPVL